MKVTVEGYQYTNNKFTRFMKRLIFEKIKKIDIDAVANEVSDFLVSEMVSNLEREGSVVTRTLMDSIVRRKVDDGKVVVSVEAPYASIVEHGRGIRGDRTFPNPQTNVNPYAIEEWVRMKFGYTGRKATEVTFAIVRVLETEGHLQHAFVQPAIYKTKLWFGLNKDKLKKIALKGELV